MQKYYHSKSRWDKRALFVLFVALLILILPLFCWTSFADDLNDGIPIDDISHSDEIKPDLNISYIKRDAKSDALIQPDKKAKTAKGDRKAVQGGVLLERGTRVDGPITVIYEGNNNKTISF